MNIPSPHCFWHPGTAEYILVRVGLFHVVDLAISPTHLLTRLLRPLDPLPDELLPLLIRMAECAAIELGGAIDTGALRSRLVVELRNLGLRHGAIGDLFVLVGKGAGEAAEDRRKEPAVLPL
jgi:hypothetical protein